MTGNPKKQLLLALLAPILLGTFVLCVRVARDPSHAQIESDFADLRLSEDALNQALASVPTAPRADYDSLAGAAQEMTLSAVRLPGDLHRVYSGRQSVQIDLALQNYRDALAQKLMRVEDFKSRDALLRACPTGSGLPLSVGPLSLEPNDDRTRVSLAALANAYEMQNTQVRLGALFSGLGFAFVSALLLGGFSALGREGQKTPGAGNTGAEMPAVPKPTRKQANETVS